jgi:hypothetical protein
MYAGLGIAPQVVGALAAGAAKIIGGLFGSSEGDRLEAESRAGNVVAWWRLKAMVQSQLPARGTINGQPFDAKALTAEERAALVQVAGPEALKEDRGGGLFDSPTRNRVFRIYASGQGDQLDAESRRLLAAQGSSAAAPAVGNLGPLLVIAGVGIAALALLRR